MKKVYNAPELTIHGNIEVITQEGGKTFVDAPIGTPIGVGAGS